MVCSLHNTPHEFVCRGTCDGAQWQNWGNTKVTRRARLASIAVATDQDLDRDFAPLGERASSLSCPPNQDRSRSKDTRKPPRRSEGG
jgi:hypothetical protein